MPSSHRSRLGFTLIELMITVAIIAVLASVAIPAFRNYQLKSKRAEAFSNLSGIAKMEQSYFAEYDAYTGTEDTSLLSYPGSPGADKRAWTSAGESAFGALGWSPDGAVYYDYGVNVDDTVCPERDCFTAAAFGDLDGNGVMSVVTYVQPNQDGSAWPEEVVDLDPNMPPIDPVSGEDIFNQVAVHYGGDQF